jgi:hypothetical protein
MVPTIGHALFTDTIFLLNNIYLGPRGRIHNTSFSSQLEDGYDILVFHYTKPLRLAKDKHSSLLGTFLSNEENEVL